MARLLITTMREEGARWGSARRASLADAAVGGSVQVEGGLRGLTAGRCCSLAYRVRLRAPRVARARWSPRAAVSWRAGAGSP